MTKQSITTFLTFQNECAEKAMNFYISVFQNSRLVEAQRYGKEGPGPEGSIMKAIFELNGVVFMCSDSFISHNWTFTPAVSNWVECETESEIGELFEKLSAHGEVKMPLDNYGFSSKFCFIEDQFGVAWQLNLE